MTLSKLDISIASRHFKEFITNLIFTSPIYYFSQIKYNITIVNNTFTTIIEITIVIKQLMI